MRRKRPSELESGIDRVLDTHTPTRETFILTWGGRTSSQGQTPHPSKLCSTPSTRSCALYRGCITVRRAGPKLVAKRRRQLCKDSAKGCVACSAELAGCLFEPVQSYDHRRSFVAALFGIRAMSRWSLVALAWPPSWGGSALQSWRAESIAFSMHTHQNATSRLNGAPIISWFDPRRVLPMMVDATRLAGAAMLTPLPPRTGGHALAASRSPASSGSPTSDVVRGHSASPNGCSIGLLFSFDAGRVLPMMIDAMSFAGAAMLTVLRSHRQGHALTGSQQRRSRLSLGKAANR